MKVALLYNPKPAFRAPDAPDDADEEYDDASTIAAIQKALGALDHDVDLVEADRRMPRRLEDGAYHFAFNIAEGRGRRCRESIAAAICELLALPYTGSDVLTLAATLDKWVARKLVSPDVPVAPAVLLNFDHSASDPVLSCAARNSLLSRVREQAVPDANFCQLALGGLRYPVIVKPNDEGSSKGIREDALAENPDRALESSRRLHARYGCPVLVEEFLSGAEVTVGIVGNVPGTEVLGMMEIAPVADDPRFVYSIEVKRDWRRRVEYFVPPRLSAPAIDAVTEAALRAYRLLGCRDFARMDFRLDSGGRPCFLDCNPLPGLDPENSDLVILARGRLSYEQLVQRIFLEAVKRYADAAAVNPGSSADGPYSAGTGTPVMR